MTLPSTSNEPSSLDPQRFDRVCSQSYCKRLLWPGSKSDICDRCLARTQVCNASTNPRDATWAYAKTASRVEGAFYDPKNLRGVTSVAPGSIACTAPLPTYPLPSPYLLPRLSSQLESSHSFEAATGTKPPGRNSSSMSYQRSRSVNPLSPAIGVPLNYYPGLPRHKPNAYALTHEQNRTHPQICGVCRAVTDPETVCSHCFDTAPSKEKTRFEQREYISDPKENLNAAIPDLEDDLSSAAMAIFSNPDENLDHTDDMDMEGIELAYPEAMDNKVVEEPQLEPAQESSTCIKGNLPPEKNSRHSSRQTQKIPNRKETPRNTSRSLKLCSTLGCTGTISSESPASRCLGCVRKDWRSKTSRGRASHRADGLKSEIRPSISTKQKTKKAVTWADEVSTSQQKLECTPTKPIRRTTPCMDSSSKSEIDDSPAVVGLNVEVGRLPSPTETRVPIKCLESNDPKAQSKVLSVCEMEDLPASSSSTPLELASNDDLRLDTQVKLSMSLESGASLDTAEVSIFGGSSDLSDLSDSGDDNESDEDISSSDLQKVGPHLPKLETSSSPLALTGLKIRIPPRPGLYVRNCGSIRCEQRLPATYRWKSCVMCRARTRGYRRMRQNPQGQHSQLEEALLGSFSKNIHVVAGARLCSDRYCTHIIPPFKEYLWNRCALCRLRARSSRKFDNACSPQEIDSRAKIAERLPVRDKHLAGRCQSLDCGVLLSGEESALDCNQCVARSLSLTNDGPSKQSMLEQKAKSNLTYPSLAPSPYPRYKAFPNLLADLKARFNDFLQAQSVFFLCNEADSRLALAKAQFIFDAEYSIVALDFDIVGRKDAVDGNVLKLKGEIERMGRIQFSPKRHIAILEGGGLAERFMCLKQAPVFRTVSDGQNVSTTTYLKNMQGELEIAVVPDHSHPFLPGHRTIVRFRLLG